MKLLDYILLILIVVGIFYYFLFPNEIHIKGDTEYLPGDTTEIIINQEKFDSLTYHFKAQIRKVKRSKNIFIKGETDTLRDTVYLSFWSQFNLGDSTLGTSGNVSFDFEEFHFDSISYRYPEKLKTVTDTLKFTKMVQEPFYLDEWFYISVALLLLLLSSIGGY